MLAIRRFFGEVGVTGDCAPGGEAPVVSQTGRSILHTQDETARALVFGTRGRLSGNGQGNQPTVREQIEKLVAAIHADFPPS